MPTALPELVVMEAEEIASEKETCFSLSNTTISNNANSQRQEKLKLRDLKRSGKSWQSVQLGSPPLKKYDQEFGYKLNQENDVDKKKMLKFEQPQSLDCDGMAPMIKITPMSDLESDSDSSMLHHLPVMDYLSPLCLQVITSQILSFNLSFVLLIKGNFLNKDILFMLLTQVPGSPHQVTVSTCSSESNLSSSGYSSISSPGGSRRGSYNRLLDCLT